MSPNLDLWQPLIEGLIESAFIVDGLDFHILAVNRNACRTLGTEAENLVGRPVSDLAATPEDMFFWEDIAAGRSEEILSATMLRRFDGSILHVDRRVSRVMLDGRRLVYVVGINDQSERRRVEDELEKIVAELRATLESTADGILVVDLDNGIRSYNQRFAELWDLPHDLMVRRDDAAVHAWLAGKVMDGEGYEGRLRTLGRSPLAEAIDLVVLRCGRVLERVSLPQYARGRPIGRVFSFRDITKRLADEARLQLAAKVFSSSLDAILITDAAYRIVATNPQSWQLTGHPESELIGRDIGQLLYQPEDENFIARLEHNLEENGYWEGEIWNRRKDGSSTPVLSSFVRVADEQGEGNQYVVFFKDLTERLAANKRIEELAYHDVLTGLPNRVLLGERIDFALRWASREEKSFAILFIDLDRFKHINDSLGHLFGDKVLVEVAERIKACLRQSDTAARLGGDEFVLLLHDVEAHGVEATAQRVLKALSRPFTIDNLSFTVTCSIGIALYPSDGQCADDLIKNADTAMYRVKEHGRADFRFYQRQMNVDLLSRMKLDQAMRQALEEGRFRLHYQPLVDVASGRIVGAEALIRWKDEELGEVPPNRFIPLAEETGFIAHIGEWVLQESVRQAADWRRRGLDLVVAINVSALQFRKTDFVHSVATALRHADLPPEAIELELTESILVQDADEALSRLQELADLGVQLSIDDFGTGYSSLTYLKRFPIHKLKIDRSFVDGLPHDASDTAIVTAVINLGRALMLEVIAEGVETEAQRQFLQEAGCGQFQGYLVSPAVKAGAFDALLERTPPRPESVAEAA
ncbi:MAG TPA: EAL domain-containing protein [Rhodocyclaceae bacterium]|nr:EAL domain-containing protein [Rhodocyclaceae bacterium]